MTENYFDFGYFAAEDFAVVDVMAAVAAFVGVMAVVVFVDVIAVVVFVDVIAVVDVDMVVEEVF